MMKHSTCLHGALVFFSTAAIACAGDADGVGVAVQAVSQNADAPLVVIDDNSAEFALVASSLSLRDIELDLPDGESCADVADLLVGARCDASESNDRITIDGPFDVDLVTGESTPSLADVVIPAGTYKRIDFRVDDNGGDHSFSAVADFERDGAAMTLDLRLDFNEDIRIEADNGVVVEAGDELLTSFVVDNWLAGIDVGTCIDRGDLRNEGSTVYIDDESKGDCSDIENTIKENMKTSGQLDR